MLEVAQGAAGAASLDPARVDRGFSARGGVGAAIQYEIEQFLFFEASLLDERRVEDWLALLTDDIRYLMPVRRNITNRTTVDEWQNIDELNYFDEDKAALELRVRKLRTGFSWAEDPASRTRHMVTNVRAMAGERDGEYMIQCAFLCYRNRAERQAETLVGKRHDILRRADGEAGFAIARRTIYIDQATLLTPSISFFL